MKCNKKWIKCTKCLILKSNTNLSHWKINNPRVFPYIKYFPLGPSELHVKGILGCVVRRFTLRILYPG